MTMEQMAVKLTTKYSNAAYRGEIDNYEYQLTMVNAGLGIKQYYLTFIMDKTIPPLQMKAIRKEVGMVGLLFSSVIHESNAVSIFVRNVVKAKEKATLLVDFFKSRDMKVLSKEIYGTDEEITGYKIINVKLQQGLKQEVTIPVNEFSYEKKLNQMVDEVKAKDSDNTHLIGGIVFAVIGAVVGVIPSVIAYEFGFMSWWLYLIVPFASFFAYKHAKGPQHGWVPLLIGVITIVVSVSVFMYTWLSFASFNNLTLSELFEVEGAFAGFIQDALFLLIGNIVGIAVSYRSIYNRTTAAKVKNLEAMK